MINYLKACHKLKSGILLDNEEIKQVKSFMFYQITFEHVLLILFITFLLSVGVLIQINYKELLLLSISIYIFSFVMSFLSFPFCIPYARRHYEECLNKYLIIHLAKYNGYKLKYTTFLPHTSFDIEKGNIYFFFDDYYFHCVESLLKKESCLSFKKNRVFSYPDVESVNKSSIDFKLSEIVSFEGNINVPFKEDSTMDIVNVLSTEKPNCKIALSNFKTIYVGESLVTYFRTLIPEREII